MTNPQKSFSFQIAGNLLAALFGVFLASFAFSFVMNGIWAFVLAMVGGAANSILLRVVRIKMKALLPGLYVGYLTCLMILIWGGTHWSFSVNLWVSAVYVSTLGLIRAFLSDDLLVDWLNKIFPKSDVQNKS